MNIVEGISIKTTPAPKKLRKAPGYWNWPELVALAQKALDTQQEQSGSVNGHYYAVVTPKYWIIKEKQTPEYKANHEKVRIAFYNLAFTFSVEKSEETIPPAWLKK